MKTLLRSFVCFVCFVGLSAPVHAQKNVQKSDATATRDEITADLKFGTGKTATFLTGSTLTLNSGSTLTLNGAIAGTPTGGTLSLANLTLTLPTSFVTLTGTQTLTNKTLTTPIIASISNTGTLTLPTATDTLIGRATTDTLTGKSLALGSNTLTGTSAQLATAISDETGSGALVFGTTPTLTTPVLGAATATSITGATDLTLSGGSSGASLVLGSGANAGVTVAGTGTGATATAVNTGGLRSANFGLSTVSGGPSYFGGNINAAGSLTVGSTSAVQGIRTATATYDPPSVIDGDTAAVDVTCTGAAVGDTASASFSNLGAARWVISAHVASANTVRVVMLNKTGITVDMASGTVRVSVFSF